MDTAVGYSVLLRGFRLDLSVDGLKPHTISNYVRDAERFASLHAGRDRQSISPTGVRALRPRPARRVRPEDGL